VIGRLNRLVGRHLPGFPRYLAAATAGIGRPERGHRPGAARHCAPPDGVEQRRRSAGQHPQLLEELAQRKQALKQAAATPVERATIEIVALLSRAS
jgi:hypothetical protein